MANRLFLIGVDGATMDIIAPLAKDGQLPNFARLISEGSSGLLASTVPCISPVAWTSFSTGMNPGKHGIYDFTNRIPGKYAFTMSSALGRKTKPLWVMLSEAKKTVSVIGCMLTYPPDPVNGVMISGPGTPSRKGLPVVEDYTYPMGLSAQITNDLGPYKTVLDINPRKIDAVLKDKIMELVRYRVKMSRYFMSKHLSDFNMLFFGETDVASHFFWHDREFIHDIYKAVDSCLGEVMAIPESNVFLMSDHGFSERRKVFFIDKWLKSKGYLSRRSKKLGARLRRIISKKPPHEDYLNRIIWKDTKAFTALSSAGNIFLNIKDREPEGILTPDECEKTLASLVSDLEGLADPDTGAALIRKAYRKKDAFTGNDLSNAPDVTLAFNEGYGAGMPTIEDMETGDSIIADSLYWKGDHHKDGVFMAWGPDVRIGHTLSGAAIIDVAPTILYSFGLPVFKAMDGKVLDDAFSPEFVSSNPVAMTNADLGKGADGRDLTAAENEYIANVLRNLGYLE
ncbi:MAG: alkaline phosphatase family protein [Deltaproteobacteria bacterium]|nr:alkaline phosphatase family protein [Deltaproteobacteria bacterium]